LGFSFLGVFNRRLQINLIPNEIRTSFYSLVPTLITLFGLLFAFFGGWIITNYGFASGILFLVGTTSFGSSILGLGLKFLASLEASSEDVVKLQKTTASSTGAASAR
ncbi:MAG: hypothetical protein ACXAD7_22820, partial [Candidatus Kariarchaeaceae archaeon]